MITDIKHALCLTYIKPENYATCDQKGCAGSGDLVLFIELSFSVGVLSYSTVVYLLEAADKGIRLRRTVGKIGAELGVVCDLER